MACGTSFPCRYSTFLFLLAVVFASPAHAGWENYKPGTLAATIGQWAETSKEPAEIPSEDQYALLPGQPMRVDVVFTGRTRTLPHERWVTIEFWAKSFGIDLNAVETFEKEIEVREDGKAYWLPIQNVLLPYLKEEVGKNGRVTLLAVFIGRRNKDHMFLVNEFKAL